MEQQQTSRSHSARNTARPDVANATLGDDDELVCVDNSLAQDGLASSEGSWFDQPAEQESSSWWSQGLGVASNLWSGLMDATGLGTDEASMAPSVATPTVETPTVEGTTTEAPKTAAPKSGPYTDTYGKGNTDARLQVDHGQLTFDAEGTEGGTYHTRTAHWPGGVSGVTIGRGYDLGQHSKKDIEADMTTAGVSASDAAKFSPAAGRTGTAARDWLATNKTSLPEISLDQQKALFDIVYGRLAGDVERISGNYAKTVSERDGGKREDYEVNWETLHPAIRDLVVDLRYRGDYTPATRKYVQPLIIANDLQGLATCMADRTLWSGVPKDRFDRRAAYMREAADGGTVKTDLQSTGPTTGEVATEPAGETAVPSVDVSIAGQQYVITATTLNVRSEPDSSKDNKLGKLAKGAKVTATGKADGWVQIQYGGQSGWISADFARLVTKEDEAATPATGDMVLSGANWYGLANQNGWKNSTDFGDLDPTFGGNCQKFVEGLRSSGANVSLTAGLRHKKRAYLMHFAWHVSKGSKSAATANEVCRAEGINIEWDHGNAAQTKTAAGALVKAFGLVHAASLTSNHMSGQAMDMKISNVPSKVTIGGKEYSAGAKGSGQMDEDKVDHSGKELGVIWFGAGDWVHWSKTGR